jgi:hypothetical protein
MLLGYFVVGVWLSASIAAVPREAVSCANVAKVIIATSNLSVAALMVTIPQFTSLVVSK